MDLRVLIVLAPLLIAAAWALKNILPAALEQFSGVIEKWRS